MNEKNQDKSRSAHWKEFVETEFEWNPKSAPFVPREQINPEDDSKIDKMPIHTLSKRIENKLKQYQEQQEQGRNGKECSAMDKIQYVVEQCETEWKQMQLCFQDEIEYFGKKMAKRDKYAFSCFKQAAEQSTLSRSEEIEKSLRIDASNNAKILFSVGILNVPPSPILALSYMQLAKCFAYAGNWNQCNYDCRIVMQMMDCTDSIRQLYVYSCIKMANARLNKIKLRQTDKHREHFMRLTLKYLDHAEIANLMVTNEEFNAKFIKLIKSVRAKCCVYQLDNESNEPLPIGWSNALENTKFDVNHSLAAKKDFKAGETVFFERPFVFLPKYVLHYCGNCSRRLNFQFVPCIKCNEVVYCDFECRAMAIDHNQTCGYEYRVASLLSVECHQVYHLLARQKQEEIDKVVNEVSQNPFQTNLISSFPAIQLSATLTGRVYVTKFEDPTMENTVVSQAIQVALILINKCTKFNAFRDNPAKLSKCVYYLLLSHYVSPFTGNTLRQARAGKLNTDHINAHGMFGYRLKHSCVPNLIRRYNPRGQIVYMARRNIKETEVLTINYGVDRSQPLLRRCKYLHKYFNFDVCQCVKCAGQLAKPHFINSITNQINKLTLARAKIEKDIFCQMSYILEANCTLEQARLYCQTYQKSLKQHQDRITNCLLARKDAAEIEIQLNKCKEQYHFFECLVKKFETVESSLKQIQSNEKRKQYLLVQLNGIQEIIGKQENKVDNEETTSQAN